MLDTNICVEVIRKRAKDVIAEFHAHPPGKIGISSITLAELQNGVARSSDPARALNALAHFCAPIQVLPFFDSAAIAYGELRAQLESSGTPIGPLDTLIAAHALSLQVTLVTNNERKFRRVPALHVINWVKKKP